GGDARGGGVRLDQHVHEVEALAEAILDQRGVPAIAIGAGEAAGAFENVGRSSEALLGQERSRDAALRGMRGLDALAGGARILELRDAGRIAAGEPDRVLDLARRIGAAEEQTAGARGGTAKHARVGILKETFEAGEP